MDIEIYDKNLNGLDILEKKQSVYCGIQYDGVGKFEIYAPASKKTCNLLQKGNLVYNPYCPNQMGVVKNLQIKSTFGEGSYITASGTMSNGLLQGKLTTSKKFSGNVQTTMREYIQSICMDSSSLYHSPIIELGNLDESIIEELDGSTKYTDLAEFVGSLCSSFGLGYRLRPDLSQRKLLFECYRGVDRSINQMTHPQMIFATEYENVESSEYNFSQNNSANVVLAYTDSGYSRETFIYNPLNLSGDEVIAKAVKCDAQFYTVTDPDTGESHQVYDYSGTYSKMKQIAMAEYRLPTENFKGISNQIALNSFGIDWDLGDIVTFRNSDWNKEISQRVCEVGIISDETSPFYVKPVFGSREFTLSELFKKKG